jgi:hypothetical protein
MKKLLLIISIITFFRISFLEAEVLSDNYFFVTMSMALDCQNRTTMTLNEKATNANALYLLNIKASEAQNISNIVRLTVLDITMKAYNDYTASVLFDAANLENFVNSSNLSVALFLLNDSLQTLEHIPTPHAYLNVLPPVWTPGGAIAGMDPNGIKDPKAQAEYERRIAENNLAIEEINIRHNIQNSVDRLKNLIERMASNPNTDKIKAQITASPLPEKIKTEIIRRQPKA